MKKIIAILLTAMMTLNLAACGSEAASETSSDTENVAVSSTETEEETTGETKIITDHAGNQVEIPTEINSIILGSVYPIASVLTVYLGSAEKIKGIHPVSMSAAENGLLGELYPEILDAETGYINGDEINVEEVLKLDPDIAIGVTTDQAEVLAEAGIPAVVVSPSAWEYDVLETYNQWVDLLDQIFGQSEISERVSTYSQEAYDSIQERVSTLSSDEKKKVLILFKYDESAMITSGPNFFGQNWCDSVGAINVAEEIADGSTVAINMEQVYEWNPDIIIITNFTGTQPEDLYNNAIGGDDWSTVNAVKNGQVYKMPLGLYRTFTPGADTPVTLQWFAKTVYPELFSDIDVEEVTRAYFSDYYGVEVTDTQLEKMYHPSSAGADGL